MNHYKFGLFVILIFLLRSVAYAQDTGNYHGSSKSSVLSNSTGKNSGMKSLASFVIGNLWDETRKRLNLDNISIKKEEDENNKTTYNFNVKSGKVKISGKIPKKL
ncbi:MAG: hypothetical protein A3G23_01290 [Bacteroidetes bacterium RIFCSPLOWO2_12_FULL_37_12]|nr:MAG: hypothetical protein A3G23_01290 [Bacteroidetes bacterium RIFCSPLOWO2_12_FULL_37_12]